MNWKLSNGIIELEVSEIGGTINHLRVPDKDGKFVDVASRGALVGRVANRIKDAEFCLNGKTYQVLKNDGNNYIHGSWMNEPMQGRMVDENGGASSARLVLERTSADGEDGFPGAVRFQATYKLNGKSFEIELAATSTEDTIINVTNHIYFNLNGVERQDGEPVGKTDISGHRLSINADSYTPVGERLIPTGEIASVQGTEYDFREEREIGTAEKGYYDINYVVSGEAGSLRKAAALTGDVSGIALTAYTTQAGMQLYNIRDAVCLEMQIYPSAITFDNFPSCILRKGEEYRQTIIYAFE